MEYRFTEARPFFAFIEGCRDRIHGQRINTFYASEGGFDMFVAGGLAFDLDDFSIVINYHFYSDIRITITDKGKVKEVDKWLREEEFPYIGHVIDAIELKRFSGEIITDPATGAFRPYGGDYFTTITVHLDGGKQFYICAAPSICDGGTEIWD